MKRNSQFAKRIYRSTIVAVSSFIVVAAMYFLGVFDFLENKSFDHRTVATSSFVPCSEDIILIAINQDCLDYAKDKYGWSWPWPRSSYGKMVEFISAGNVNAISFDIFFTEDSVYGKDDDEEFAEAIKNSGKVIHTLFSSGKEGREKIMYPVESIKNAAAIIGNSTSIKDKDDVIRKARVYSDIDGNLVPSMGIAPLLLQNEQIKKLPLQKDGSVILRFQKSIKNYTFRYATDVLDSYEDWKDGKEGIYVPEDFDDAYVYFAVYGPGLFDICATPVSQVYPGVGVHITQLDNYLNNTYVKTVPAFFVVLWLLIISFFGSFIVAVRHKSRSQTKSVLIMYGEFLLGLIFCVLLPYVLFIFGIWMPLVAPLALLFLSFLVTLGLVYTIEGKQRRFIRAAFSQCLSKEVVKEIIEHPETFRLGGYKYEMSAIFTDIQKFSSFSELLTAGQLVALLNYYLTRMSDVIMAEGGTIDKYEGDAIIALMGAPLAMQDHGERAVKAAVKMKQCEKLLNAEIHQIVENGKPDEMDEELFSAFKIMVENGKEIFTRIGINSGEMIAGFMGSDTKKNFTMMGNNVNLASRLEGVNKQYSTGGILISEYTKNLLGSDFIVRTLDRVRVVNVNTPLRLYEPLGIKSENDDCKNLISYVDAWEKAISLFEEHNYNQALEIMKTLAEENPEDKVALYYIRLIEKYFINGKFPVESDGEGVAYNTEDGVFKLLQK